MRVPPLTVPSPLRRRALTDAYLPSIDPLLLQNRDSVKPDARPSRAALLGIALVAAVTVALLWAVAGGHPPRAFDRTLFAHLHGERGDAGVGFAGHLTAIGDGPRLIAVLTALGLAARARLGSWTPLFVTGGAVVGSAAASTVIKSLADRARPPAAGWLAGADGASFPSGHTTVSTAGYLALGLSVGALARSATARAAAWAAGVAMALAMGWTRIELAVHWPTDVLAGWAVGTCAACLAVVIWPLLVLRAAAVLPAHRATVS